MLKSKLALGLNIYHIIVDGLHDAIPIFLAFIVLTLGTGEREVGVIVSLVALFSTLASLGTVYLSERYSMLTLTAFTVLLYGVGYMGAAFSHSLFAIGLAFVFATLGHQLFHNISFTYFSDVTSKNKIGRVISDFTALGDIGRIPFMSLAGLCGAVAFYGFEGWRLFLFLYGLATIVFLGISFPFVKKASKGEESAESLGQPLEGQGRLAGKAQESEGDAGEQGDRFCLQASDVISRTDNLGSQGRSVAQQTDTEAPQGHRAEQATQKAPKKNLPSLKLLGDKRVLLTIIANMLNVLSSGALFIFLPLLLLAKGFDPKILGGLGLGFSIGCFVGKIICGRLIDRYGSSRIFMASHAILTLLLWGLVSDISLSVVLALAFAIGFVTKGSVPTVQTILIEYIPSEYYKDIFSINTFFRGVIMIIIPFMYGLISEQYGITQIYVLMAVFSIVAIVPIFIITYCKLGQGEKYAVSSQKP